MEKFIALHRNLEYCYTRTPFDVFIKLPQDQQDRMCQRERETLIEYVQSNEMNFENNIKSKLKLLQGRKS
jgi:hypothetical protein